jgi:hypothetical protein
MGVHTQNFGHEVFPEAVHDREHHDQGHDTHHDTCDGDKRDDGNEGLLPLGPEISGRDEELKLHLF